MKMRVFIERLMALQEIVGSDTEVYLRALIEDWGDVYCEPEISSTKDGEVLLIDGKEVKEP